MLKTHPFIGKNAKSEKPSIISQLLHSKYRKKAPFWHSGLSYIMHFKYFHAKLDLFQISLIFKYFHAYFMNSFTYDKQIMQYRIISCHNAYFNKNHPLVTFESPWLETPWRRKL
jgi:hypothetical protein